jgi:hypothetical protein
VRCAREQPYSADTGLAPPPAIELSRRHAGANSCPLFGPPAPQNGSVEPRSSGIIIVSGVRVAPPASEVPARRNFVRLMEPIAAIAPHSPRVDDVSVAAFMAAPNERLVDLLTSVTWARVVHPHIARLATRIQVGSLGRMIVRRLALGREAPAEEHDCDDGDDRPGAGVGNGWRTPALPRGPVERFTPRLGSRRARTRRPA